MDHALFVKDGVPVKFCFHRSVREGRGQLTRDIERHGGSIVQDERRANVLLVDEQENIDLFRRQYYSSTKVYRLSLFVERRGFVQTCIRLGQYRHVGPAKQGMPGVAPGGARARTAFTEEDRERLAYYLATRFPTRDGRLGNNAYKDLMRLAEAADPSWAWARRHTFHSWREYYKMNRVLMDERIEHYLAILEPVGHHHGHDPRRHDRWNVRREEEEEEEEVEQEQQQDRERRPPVRPAVAAAAQGHDLLGGHEQGPVAFEEEGDGAQEEVAVQEMRRVKRHRVQVQRQRDDQETQAKRARVSNASLDGRRAPAVETGRGRRSQTRKSPRDSEARESQEIEGSDLFGDHTYEEEQRIEFDDAREVELPMPYSPRRSPLPELDGAPLSTQATLVASPYTARKEPVPTPGPTPAGATALSSPQQAPIVTQGHVVVQRARVRGASAQHGPSVPREARARGGVASPQAPYQNTRARSRSVDPQPQPDLWPRRARPRQDPEGKGKAKAEPLMPIEEDMQGDELPMEVQHDNDDASGAAVVSGLQETFEDEIAVQGLLEVSVGGGAAEDEADIPDEDAGNMGASGDEDDGGEMDGDEDVDILVNLPRFQDVEVSSSPTDSDDAETHGSLVRAARNRSANEADAESGPGPEEAQEHSEDSDEDAQRIERMARGSLHVVAAPTPPVTQSRMTRSRSQAKLQPQPPTQTQSRVSPRRTGSGNQAHNGAVERVFPSPGTKARAAVDRVQDEERRLPYTPPQGSRAANAVKGRTRRG